MSSHDSLAQLAQDWAGGAQPQSFQLWKVLTEILSGEVQPPSDTVLTMMEVEPWVPPEIPRPGGGNSGPPQLRDASAPSSPGKEQAGLSQAITLLKMMGVEIPSSIQELAGRDEEAERATKHQQLMLDANYGVAAPRAFPSEEVLKKMATSAKAGHWIPPEIFSRAKGDRVLAEGIKQLSMVAHPAIWHHFMSPAMVLNEIWQVSSIAADSTMARDAAETLAVEYATRIRSQLWDEGRSTPVDSPSFQEKLKEAWHEKSPVAMDEARRALPYRPAGKPGAATSGASHCLWHNMLKCTNNKCTLLHSCPFCSSREAGCLTKHLAALRQPRHIVPKGKGSGTDFGADRGGKGGKPFKKGDAPRRLPWEKGVDPKNQDRGRSRSRKRSRSKDRRKRSRS